MSFQTCMTSSPLWNVIFTKYILNNIGNQTLLLPLASIVWTKKKWLGSWNWNGNLNFKHLLLCSAEQINDYRFGTTWELFSRPHLIFLNWLKIENCLGIRINWSCSMFFVRESDNTSLALCFWFTKNNWFINLFRYQTTPVTCFGFIRRTSGTGHTDRLHM